ncbi:hypothetical protein HRG_014926 [Hirsutella rhossiliensis]
MKLFTNLLLLGALASSVLSTAIPEVAEEAEVGDVADSGVSTPDDAPGSFAEARAVRQTFNLPPERRRTLTNRL